MNFIESCLLCCDTFPLQFLPNKISKEIYLLAAYSCIPKKVIAFCTLLLVYVTILNLITYMFFMNLHRLLLFSTCLVCLYRLSLPQLRAKNQVETMLEHECRISNSLNWLYFMKSSIFFLCLLVWCAFHIVFGQQ